MTRLLATFLLWMTTLTLATAAEVSKIQAAGRSTRSFKLKGGCTISTRILEDRHQPLRQQIAITGEIWVPHLGLIRATGLTCDELAARIKSELEKSRSKNVSVEVTLIAKPLEFGPSKLPIDTIFVVAFGKVAHQGRYDIPKEGLTVSTLLKRAGGSIPPKRVPKIRIIRKTPQGHKSILVNARAIVVQKSAEYDLYLRVDDVMIVE